MDTPANDRSNLELIHSETQRIAGIVHNLLSFARQGSARPVPVDVVAVITQVVEMKVRDFRVHDINLTVDLPERLPPVTGDRQQLVEVLLNIISNAQYELTEYNGHGELVIRASALGDRVRVSVIDDGPGILRQNLGRIFDPFFTTKDVGRGTGLGLSICHGIVSQHGGNLWAESPPGQGATFHLELPLSRWSGEAPEPVSEEEAPRPSLLHKRVLVVDDEPGIRSLVYGALSPWGCSVDLAKDGEAAWQALQHTSYDRVFIDLNMPGTSGKQLYRLIRERDGDLAGRRVFLTGATFSPETRGFVAAVGNTVLEKPVSLHTLRQVVAGL